MVAKIKAGAEHKAVSLLAPVACMDPQSQRLTTPVEYPDNKRQSGSDGGVTRY